MKKINRLQTIAESLLSKKVNESEDTQRNLAVILHNGNKMEYWDGTMFIDYQYIKYDLSEAEAEIELDRAGKHCLARGSETMPYIDRTMCQH
jgi:hypothetical protein